MPLSDSALCIDCIDNTFQGMKNEPLTVKYGNWQTRPTPQVLAPKRPAQHYLKSRRITFRGVEPCSRKIQDSYLRAHGAAKETTLILPIKYRTR